MPLFFESVGQGPALVILHGLFGSSDNWRTVTKPLTQRHTVLYVDLRNHGRSPHDPDHSYALMAEDVRELLDREGIPQADVLGHSMGGKVAAQLAFSYPHLVHRLVVVDIGLKQSKPHHEVELRALHAVDLPNLQTRQQADQQMLAAGLQSEMVRQFFLKNLYRPETGGFAWRFNLAALTSQYANILQAVGGPGDVYDGPTLFIRGGKSNYVLDADVPAIRTHFPQFQLVTVPDAGHWVHAEQPVVFMQAVESFLATPFV